ncbi:AraC family transcriptional regulator [Amycolatopsis orientalis]|uniref:AraC family transcriptional regulator n=1 Tax=Amycolatopsis orientalis TaxID=31958 RepID=UPI0009F431DC|nr:AraC family transcriptional regulator [Amycolatopsis orientalis]
MRRAVAFIESDAHRDITVADIAARWGFLHPSRFAHYYRAACGRSPLGTLHDGE